MDRSYGVLMALSSLSGDFGIGTMGKEARIFIDALVDSGARWWQMLPLTQPGPGDSPYQSVSAFAGSYYYIDFEELFKEGLLTKKELDKCRATFFSSENIDYQAQREHKLPLLYPIYERMDSVLSCAVEEFEKSNGWVTDYSTFMAEETGYDSKYFILLQVLFTRQYDKLRKYASDKGISLIGDMPIYVAPGGVEERFYPELFDKSGAVAGCPPDAFTDEGQLWSNPLYDWEAMKRDGYGWWIRRFAIEFSRFDLVRVDHFRGFEAYWAVPGEAVSAKDGKWIEGPGAEFFKILKSWFGSLPVIAEDLGDLTPSFFEFMDTCGFPGMKVLQFAFSPGANSTYLPHNGIENSVIYTGTHDNDTIRGWWKSLDEATKEFAKAYLGGEISEVNAADRLIRAAMSSVSKLCVIPMQDILNLDESARMNIPGTPEGNWRWRMNAGAFCGEICEKMKQMSKIYAR